MHFRTKLALLLALVLMVPGLARAQTVGNCQPAIGDGYLDINNVRARIFNNGNFFWRSGAAQVYEVPKGSGESAIFASGIWLGGFVGNQLRFAGTTYGPYEFWAGPLDPNGNPPADCGAFDRIYKVSKEDVVAYNDAGTSTRDLREWPTGLGAPTLDADGNLIELDYASMSIAERQGRIIDLAGGERPAITGDQMLWWIMNDRGNTHGTSGAPPLGIEVHGSAFAFNVAGAVGNTTFYRFRIFSRNTQPITDTYMALFSDPDLGDAADDYIGSDTTLGLGMVYNADNDDAGHYGTPPPALGYDFFQGPLVDSDGLDNNNDGVVDEPGERLSMTSFTYFNNGGGDQGDPGPANEKYNYMRGRWRNGQPFTIGGDGFGGDVPVAFVYPGAPETRSFWSEVNADGAGGAIPPADRRFVMSTGPFTIQPGDEQEIVYGIVWSRGEDNLDSVAKLKADDALAQAAYDVNFELPSPPAGPRVQVTEMDGRVVLTWGYNPTDNNYLNSYSEPDPFAPDESKNYVFEGYKIYRYSDTSDQVGTLIAIYDVANGVTRVLDRPGAGEPEYIAVNGTDSGLQNYHVIDGLTNYTTYIYGVQAYAYNEASSPKVYNGPVTRVSAVPSPNDAVVAETAMQDAFFENAERDFSAAPSASNVGQGVVSVDVVDPVRLTGHTYRVEFKTVDVACAADGTAARMVAAPQDDDLELVAINGQTLPVSKADAASAAVLVYDIIDEETGEVRFNGTQAAQAICGPTPLGEDVVVVDGLSFTIQGPPPGINRFLTVANAAGPINPPEQGTFAFNSNGFPFLDGSDRPTAGVQQSTNNTTWGINAGGGTGTFASFLSRTTRDGANFPFIGAYDYEIRFTNDPDNYGWRAFQDGAVIENLPFELWNIGIDTPDDPSDDIRLIPAISDEHEQFVFDIGLDHPVSGGTDDPYSDWIYMFTPSIMTPGEEGYQSFFAGQSSYGDEVLARLVLVNFNAGSEPPYPSALPEEGTVFRIVTDKPNQPGDEFTINTSGYGAEALTLEQQQEALENIGIVPNPYKGTSAYETSQLTDQVRFTGLPDVATIRVFTLSGTLIKTLEKNSPGVNYLTWDLVTDEQLPIASGMYLVHVEVPGVGEHVVKFGVVKKRTQLNTF